MKNIRLPKEIQSLLDGHPFRLEDGGKHFKCYVHDRFAFIWPKNGGSSSSLTGRANLNIRSQVRRILREVELSC